MTNQVNLILTIRLKIFTRESNIIVMVYRLCTAFRGRRGGDGFLPIGDKIISRKKIFFSLDKILRTRSQEVLHEVVRAWEWTAVSSRGWKPCERQSHRSGWSIPDKNTMKYSVTQHAINNCFLMSEAERTSLYKANQVRKLLTK